MLGGVSAFILGIVAGLAFGVWWASRILKKQQKNIPEDILNEFNKKEVQHGDKEEISEEERSNRRGFFGRRNKRRKPEPRGFVIGGREPTTQKRTIRSPRTKPIEERRSVPIHSSVNDKPKPTKNKPDSKKSWPSFD